MTKEWTRSETIALANYNCMSCQGSGMRIHRLNINPCNCVLRTIFRICYNRFRYVIERQRHIPPTTLERGAGRRRYVWGHKEEEFVADFHLVSKRHLSTAEWDIFRHHFLLGVDAAGCCQRLRLDRGTFFHAVYRIEQKLGRVFRDLEPYALFPLAEYDAAA